MPVPRFASWEALNAYLLEQCRQRREQEVRGEPETIGERFARDRAVFLPLPVSAYEACEKRMARVSSMSLVRYRTNDYSVPTEYGHRDVLVKVLRARSGDRLRQPGGCPSSQKLPATKCPIH
jgi:hypothetical protein